MLEKCDSCRHACSPCYDGTGEFSICSLTGELLSYSHKCSAFIDGELNMRPVISCNQYAHAALLHKEFTRLDSEIWRQLDPVVFPGVSGSFKISTGIDSGIFKNNFYIFLETKLPEPDVDGIINYDPIKANFIEDVLKISYDYLSKNMCEQHKIYIDRIVTKAMYDRIWLNED